MKFALAAVGALLSTGGIMFGFGWFAASITIPRWVMLLFLLMPVGDVQQLVSSATRRLRDKIDPAK